MGVLKPLPLQGRGLERGQSIHSKLFKHPLSRLALKIVVMALGLRQEARVKRVWAILLFFTQIGFIVFTYLDED